MAGNIVVSGTVDAEIGQFDIINVASGNNNNTKGPGSNNNLDFLRSNGINAYWAPINAGNDITAGILPVARGGTGFGSGGDSYTKGDILYATGLSSLTKLSIASDTEGYFLKVNHQGVPSWSNTTSAAITITNNTDGALNITAGGASINKDLYVGASMAGYERKISLTSNAGEIYLYSSDTSTGTRGLRISIADENDKEIITIASNEATFIGSLTGHASLDILTPSGVTAGDILYWANSTTPARLGIGSENYFLKVSSGGLPTWSEITWGNITGRPSGAGSVSTPIYWSNNAAVACDFSVSHQNYNNQLAGIWKTLGTRSSYNTSYSGDTVGLIFGTNGLFAYSNSVSDKIWVWTKDSNNRWVADRATALNTSRSLWGNSFDGSADVSGSMLIKALSSANVGTSSNNGNTGSSNWYQGLAFVDKNNYHYGEIYTALEPGGRVRTYVYSKNKKTDGTEVTNILNVGVNKDGTRYYSVSDAAAFRSAIGAGTSSLEIGTTATTAAAGNHTHSYLPLSGGTLTGNLTIKPTSTTADAFRSITAGQENNSTYTDPNTGAVRTTYAGNWNYIFFTNRYKSVDDGTTTWYPARIYFRSYSATANSGTRLSYYETYRLPACSDGKTSNNTYEILTNKSAVTIAQGGTGATTAAKARQNLFDTSMSSTAEFFITINTSWATGGYVTLAQARNLIGLGNTTGTLGVAYGGTGATTFTSGAALIGAGTGAVTTRSITNNTTAGSNPTANTNLITANTLINYKGTTNIDTVGTITSGTWNAGSITSNGNIVLRSTATASDVGYRVITGGATNNSTWTSNSVTYTVYAGDWGNLRVRNRYKSVSSGTTTWVPARVEFRAYSATANSGTHLSYYDAFALPGAADGKTANNTYSILTSKAAVTIAQGGTGATTKANARSNLGIRCDTTTGGVTVQSGSYMDINVTWAALDTVPDVVVGFVTASTADSFGRCSISVKTDSVTKTGCTVRIFNGDSSNRSPDFSYIAIG